MTLRADLEAMVSSAVHVIGQGEDLAAGHMETDSRMAGAEIGWQGASAQAINAKLGAWTQTSSVLLGRLSDHGQGLHTCATTFASHEQTTAETMRGVAESADAAATPLG